MRKLLIAIIYIVITLFLIVIFLPKKELWFLAERYLEQNKIILSHEKVSDYGVLAKLDGGVLYYDKMSAFELSSLKVGAFLAYNYLYLDQIELSSSLSTILPAKIEFLSAKHSIFFPHRIFIDGAGDFGTLSGTVDLVSRKAVMLVEAPNEIVSKYRQLFVQMKRTEQGYLYEFEF